MPDQAFNRALIAISAISVMSLAACGDSGAPDTPEAPPRPPAATPEPADPGRSVDTEAVLAALGEAYVNANLANGERMWRRCQSCHTVSEGGRHMVGPNLFAMFGREVGTAEGFRYSNALDQADFIWTAEELDDWLTNPRTYLPGNRMSFAGLRNQSDRIDLIAWLAAATAPEDFAEMYDPEDAHGADDGAAEDQEG